MFVSEVEFMLHKKQLNRIIKIQELKLKLVERSIKTSFYRGIKSTVFQL